MPPPIVEGWRVDGSAIPHDAQRVVGTAVLAPSSAAIAVPIGAWAELGVSPGSAVEELLPPSSARSDDRRERDDAEERKIKFLATLGPWQRFKVWLRRTG